MTFDVNPFVLAAFGEANPKMLATQIDAIFCLELFFDNREMLVAQWKEQVRVKREKTIKDLEQQLETHKKHLARVDKYAVMDPLETTTDALATISKDTANRINNYDKWGADLKPDTQRYADYTSSIESGLAFKTRIEDLSNKISDQAQQDYENAHSI